MHVNLDKKKQERHEREREREREREKIINSLKYIFLYGCRVLFYHQLKSSTFNSKVFKIKIKHP